MFIGSLGDGSTCIKDLETMPMSSNFPLSTLCRRSQFLDHPLPDPVIERMSWAFHLIQTPGGVALEFHGTQFIPFDQALRDGCIADARAWMRPVRTSIQLSPGRD